MRAGVNPSRQPARDHHPSRRQFTPQEKVAIVKRHLLEGVPVSTLCDQFQINPTLFYHWQKQFFENGTAAFDNSGKRRKAGQDAKDRTIAALQDKLQRKNEVVAELMDEHIKLKKELGEL